MQPTQLGRYKVIGELARNASGVIYRARDPLIDRIVSIKTVDVDLPPYDVQVFQKRLEREVRAAGRLNHPNIATIYDVGSCGNVAYIAMEFMDGRSLRDALESRAILLEARIADIAMQVAAGLQFAHEHGIVHRDVRPDSIVLLRSGLVKLTNFGIAKVSSGSRTRIEAPDTGPVYMSPEQLMGRAADERSDIFSLGAVLYEMLTGHPPFAARNVSDIIHGLTQESPATPSSANAAVSPAFDAIVAKAMARNPSDRYRSARDMASELRKLSGGAPDDATARTTASATSDELVADHDVSCDAGVDDTAAVVGASSHPSDKSPAQARRRRYRLAALSVCALSVSVVWMWLSKPPGDPPAADELLIPPARSVEHRSAADGVSRDTLPQASRLPRSDEPSKTAKPAPPSVRAVDKQPTTMAPSNGRVVMAVSPWGEVFVDGKSKGSSPPLKEIELPPGTYVVEIRNSNLAPYRQLVELGANSRVPIKYKFGE